MKNLISAIIRSEDRGYHRNNNRNSHLWDRYRTDPPKFKLAKIPKIKEEVK